MCHYDPEKKINKSRLASQHAKSPPASTAATIWLHQTQTDTPPRHNESAGLHGDAAKAETTSKTPPSPNPVKLDMSFHLESMRL